MVDVVRSESDWVQEVGPSLAAVWSGPKVRSEVGGDIMKFDVSPVRFGYGLTWVRSGKKNQLVPKDSAICAAVGNFHPAYLF